MQNLPDQVQLVGLCVMGVRRASQANPAEGRIMAGKLDSMLSAMKNDRGTEAARIAQELFPMVERYVDTPMPSAAISTGLSR